MPLGGKMKKIADYWFHSPGGLCGVIVAEDEFTGERKAYVGVGAGVDYTADRERVLALGTKLPQTRIEDILNLLKGGKVGRHTIEVDALQCGSLYGLMIQEEPSGHTVFDSVVKQLVAIKLELEKEAGVTKEILPGGMIRLTDKDGTIIVRPPFPYETEGN